MKIYCPRCKKDVEIKNEKSHISSILGWKSIEGNCTECGNRVSKIFN